MINETNKDSWCVNAFHAMSANNDGSTKMCCMIKHEYNRMSFMPKNLYIGKKSIQDNFNNSIAKDIRKNLEKGVRDSACDLCWQEEDAGRRSKRQRDNERYLNEIQWHKREPFVGLAKFELNLGNNCNIKCRTCHPSISSTWMKEAHELDHSNIPYKQYANDMKKYHQQYDEDSPFWEDLANNLETIKQFDFYGGEPFLSKKMWEILRICVDKGYSKDIELHYNTNGTNWPSAIEELWPHFKAINLSFSIDGVGEQFEYMRFPASWETVTVNMQRAREYKEKYNNISISWCITLSTINIYNLPDVVEEYYKNYSDFGVYLNLVHGPIHFNISKLPEKLKQIVIDKLETIPEKYQSIRYQLPGIIGFIQNGKYDESVWNSFLETIKKHDAYRNQEFFKTFSEYGTHF